MLSTIKNLQTKIDCTVKYLTPLLKLANCHMVEFFTEDHWRKLVPEELRTELDDLELNDAVNAFWEVASGRKTVTSHLQKWVTEAQSHCIKVDNDYCLSTDQLKERIINRGGVIAPEIRVTEFMTSKKSYEVQAMSVLVSSLVQCVGCSCAAEAGGGRGALAAALALGHAAPSLTVDCDPAKVAAARTRARQIQKQWHAIAKRIDGDQLDAVSAAINKDLHRFATAYITEDTDMGDIVRGQFPEHSETKLLLTGLHTCGDLGPSSLRIFSSQASTAALFNVPCCYHLLTEERVDSRSEGFPMSQYLKGYTLGRNARMLAAQSLDRVVNQRQIPAKSLFYRAKLQEIIKTHLPNHTIKEGKLKRLSKCSNFEHYFETSNAILNLQLDSLRESCHVKINEEGCQWKELVMFYFIRLCLAQVIETVILLDRIMFLFERNHEEVFLVKLFDPVLSPRCHGIVAIK